MDAIQKFIEETDRNYKGDADGEWLAKAITMLEVMREALNESRSSIQAVYKCIHHGHPTGGDDEAYMSTHVDSARDIIDKALQKCEQIAGGE